MNGVCCWTVRTIPCDCRWILKLPALPEHSKHHYSMDSTNSVPQSKSDCGRSLKTHDYGASFLQIGWCNFWIGQYLLHKLHGIKKSPVVSSWCFGIGVFSRYLLRETVPVAAHDSCCQAPQHVAQLHGRPPQIETVLASSSRYSIWNRLKQHAACSACINTKKHG